METLYVIKRDGTTDVFTKDKIINAILKAFIAVEGEVSDYAKEKSQIIADYVADFAGKADHVLDISEIQHLVESGLMNLKNKDVATAYIEYRHDRDLARGSVTDRTMLDYLSGNNEYWATENSNKDATVVTVQRDYIAGIASTDLARRFLLPKEVCEAHDEGIIHQHDMDYMAQNALNNCSLINLDDCLQNGTVVNGVKIDSPHRLITATTIATQIITAVASSEYGGTTITLTHLAPFVRLSRKNYYNKYISWGFDENKAKEFAEKDLKKEISDAVQTFNYQVNSMSTTNGQAPFLSVNMYLDENPEYTEEVALLIEEFLNQRILGMKNEKGVYVTQAFPKLLYVLDEDNIHSDSPYFYLTELAARCTAKRMVPDYISAKKMRELKGDVYPCMGCRSFLTPARFTANIAKAKNYIEGQHQYYGRLTA